MSSRVAAPLALGLSVWLLAVTEFSGYFGAPRDCIRFGRIEFAACVPWGKSVALENALAMALLVVALWLTTRAAEGRGVRFARALGVVGASICAIGNIASASGVYVAVMIPVAALGAGLVGGAMAVASTVVPGWRSTLGEILGITLAVWSIAYVLRDDDAVFPQGGAFFTFPYALWGVRLARRIRRGWQPAAQGIVYSPNRILHALQFGAISLGGVLLFFFILPFWIGSTFGVPIMGDPGVSVTIVNGTDEPVEFYESGLGAPYHQRVMPGEKLESGWLLASRYTPEVTDLSGNPIFCRRYTDRDLRQLRFVITIVRDPASCGERQRGARAAPDALPRSRTASSAAGNVYSAMNVRHASPGSRMFRSSASRNHHTAAISSAGRVAAAA